MCKEIHSLFQDSRKIFEFIILRFSSTATGRVHHENLWAYPSFITNSPLTKYFVYVSTSVKKYESLKNMRSYLQAVVPFTPKICQTVYSKIALTRHRNYFERWKLHHSKENDLSDIWELLVACFFVATSLYILSGPKVAFSRERFWKQAGGCAELRHNKT